MHDAVWGAGRSPAQAGGSGLGKGLMQTLAMHTPGRRAQMVSLADVQSWRLWSSSAAGPALPSQNCSPPSEMLEKPKWAWIWSVENPRLLPFPGCGRSGQGGPSLDRSRGIRSQLFLTSSLEEEEEGWRGRDGERTWNDFCSQLPLPGLSSVRVYLKLCP